MIVALGSGTAATLQFGEGSMGLYVGGLSLAITTLEGWLVMPVLASHLVRTNHGLRP